MQFEEIMLKKYNDEQMYVCKTLIDGFIDCLHNKKTDITFNKILMKDYYNLEDCLQDENTISINNKKYKVRFITDINRKFESVRNPFRYCVFSNIVCPYNNKITVRLVNANSIFINKL